jgi:NADH-quinone oxidoreductase subunit I
MVLENIVKAIKSIYQPPVTIMCPEEKTRGIPERFKGLQVLDKGKCIGCGICANTCPNNAIKIVRSRVSKTSDKQRWFPEIDIGHCMFCGLCIDQCPQDALASSKIYTSGVVKWNHEDLLFTPDELAREVEIGEDEYNEEELEK